MAEMQAMLDHLGGLLNQLSDQEKRKLSLEIGRKLRKSQSNRISKQRNPDGSAYQARKNSHKSMKPLAFLYQKADGSKRMVDIASYKVTPKSYVGYDKNAGGIRTFLRKRVVVYKKTHGSAEPLRNKAGRIKKKMFTRLKTARYMKMRQERNGIAISFLENVSFLANVHQYGLVDQVHKYAGSPKVKYPSRELLGFTPDEINMIENDVLNHLSNKL